LTSKWGRDMRSKSWIVLVLITLAFVTARSRAQDFDLSNKGLLKAAQESGKIVAENKPTSARVLEPSTYFLDAFNKPRKVGTKTFTMAGTDNKLIVCNALANAMLKLAKEKGQEVPATLQVEWVKTQQTLLDALAKENAKKETAISENEKAVWQQFFDEWLNDVNKTDAALFKDALMQAAYEITKAGLDVQTAQEAAARTGAATPAGASGGAGSLSGSSGGYSPHHERTMNRIYHHHERRMVRVERIRARG
jgi:hypothetical protein